MRKKLSNLVYYFLIPTVVVLLFAVFNQKREQELSKIDWLAIVKNDTISVDEFRTRFELTPRFGTGQEARQIYLKAMVIERLLAGYAGDNSLDTLHKANIILQQFADEALVEHLLAKVIKEKVSITEEELMEQYRRSTSALALDAWVFKGNVPNEKIRDYISRSANFSRFGEVVDARFRPEYHKDILLRYNETLEPLEELAYGLEPGEISDPILIGAKTWVLRLISKMPVEEPSQAGYQSRKKHLESVLRKRKGYAVQQEFINSLMKGQSIEIDSAGFYWLVNHLSETLPRDTSGSPIVPPTIAAPQEQFSTDRIDEENRGDLEKPFVLFQEAGKEHWTRKEVMEKLYTMPRTLENTTPADLARQLHQAILWLVEFETLKEEAIKGKIDRSSDVKTNTEIWSNNVKAQFGLGHMMEKEEIKMAGLTLEEMLDSDRTSKQMSIILKLLKSNEKDGNIQIDWNKLKSLDLMESPVLIRKTHFPNRPAMPVPIGMVWAKMWNPESPR